MTSGIVIATGKGGISSGSNLFSSEYPLLLVDRTKSNTYKNVTITINHAVPIAISKADNSIRRISTVLYSFPHGYNYVPSFRTFTWIHGYSNARSGYPETLIFNGSDANLMLLGGMGGGGGGDASPGNVGPIYPAQMDSYYVYADAKNFYVTLSRIAYYYYTTATPPDYFYAPTTLVGMQIQVLIEIFALGVADTPSQVI